MSGPRQRSPNQTMRLRENPLSLGFAGNFALNWLRDYEPPLSAGLPVVLFVAPIVKAAVSEFTRQSTLTSQSKSCARILFEGRQLLSTTHVSSNNDIGRLKILRPTRSAGFVRPKGGRLPSMTGSYGPDQLNPTGYPAGP